MIKCQTHTMVHHSTTRTQFSFLVVEAVVMVVVVSHFNDLAYSDFMSISDCVRVCANWITKINYLHHCHN